MPLCSPMQAQHPQEHDLLEFSGAGQKPLNFLKKTPPNNPQQLIEVFASLSEAGLQGRF